MRKTEKQKQATKRWKSQNIEKVRLSRKLWRTKNKDKIRAYDRNYDKRNPLKKKANDARHYAKHRLKMRSKQKTYYTFHKDKIMENVEKWRKSNWDKVLTHSANRRARVKNAEGSHTAGEWELLKIQYGFRCVKCKKQEPEIKLTRDHIIPLARGGSNYIENIQPLCGKCNCEKGAKMPEEIRVGY